MVVLGLEQISHFTWIWVQHFAKFFSETKQFLLYRFFYLFEVMTWHQEKGKKPNKIIISLKNTLYLVCCMLCIYCPKENVQVCDRWQVTGYDSKEEAAKIHLLFWICLHAPFGCVAEWCGHASIRLADPDVDNCLSTVVQSWAFTMLLWWLCNQLHFPWVWGCWWCHQSYLECVSTVLCSLPGHWHSCWKCQTSSC